MGAAHDFGLGGGRSNGDLAARPIVQLDFRGGCRSSECSEKPNDPPGKPAGFVYNNGVGKPAHRECASSSLADSSVA